MTGTEGDQETADGSSTQALFLAVVVFVTFGVVLFVVSRYGPAGLSRQADALIGCLGVVPVSAGNVLER